METKKCKECGKELPLDKFEFRKDTGKYRNQCRDCLNKKKRERYIGKHIKIETKICKECGKELPIEKFYKEPRKKDGYFNKCIECCKKTHKKYKKICEHCGKEFETTNKDAKYCSNKCNGEAHYNRVKVNCEYCGKEFETPMYRKILNNYHYCSNECRKASTKHILRGEQHPSFNHDLTEEDREKHRDFNHEQWAYEVKVRDNFTCQCCGSNKSGRLVSHHKDGYNWCKERRYDVANGVTLCEDCHKEFHNIYGYGNNTEEQYKEFINNKED